jgi:phosphatidylserine decarboxylase
MTEPPSAGGGGSVPPAALSSYLPRVHREGWPFVVAAACVTLLLAAIAAPLGAIAFLACLGVALFFRDPERMTPIADGLIIAPADGKVVGVTRAAPPADLGLGDGARWRLSIFLSILDVHINRLPVDGRIERVAYHPGRFLNAALDKASEQNERNGLVIATRTGETVAVVQIAGLVARRIRCWVRPGDAAMAGRRFGLIRFGSRVDVYLPEGATPLVVLGQRTVGGETPLADLRARLSLHRGEQR